MREQTESDYVKVGSYPDEIAASIAKADLADAGLHPVITKAGGAQAYLGSALVSAELNVPWSEVDAARAILDSSDEATNGAGEIEVPNRRERVARSAWLCALAGAAMIIPLIPAAFLLLEVRLSNESLDARHARYARNARRLVIVATLAWVLLFAGMILAAKTHRR